MSHGHFKVVCMDCGDVLAQCRCAAPSKRVDKTVCPKCKAKREMPAEQDCEVCKGPCRGH